MRFWTFSFFHNSTLPGPLSKGFSLSYSIFRFEKTKEEVWKQKPRQTLVVLYWGARWNAAMGILA